MQFLNMEIIEIPDPDWDIPEHVDEAIKHYESRGLVYLGEYIDGDLMEVIQERLAEIWN